MIEQVIEQCQGAVYLAFLASWRALPVFVVVAALSLMIRKRVPARYICWLWLIVIARLLLPVSVESSVAISSVADKPAQSLISGDEKVAVDSGGFDTFTYEDEHGESVELALLPPGATVEQQADADAYVAKITANEIAALASSSSETEFNQTWRSEQFIDMIEPLLVVLSFSLVIGLPAIAILMLLRGIVSHLRFAWRLWSTPTITDRATVDCLLRVCDDLKVGRRPQLKEVQTLRSPAMFGLLRPVICLPTGWQERLTLEQLDWVFRHEIAHIKSRDGLLLFVANIAKSLHWFNPISWIAVAKLQQHMERAADEMATRNLTDLKVREYGELLLEFAAGQANLRGSATVGLLAMAAPHGLHGRIESLASHRPKRTWLRRLMLVPAITLIAATGLTDAKTTELTLASTQQVPDFEVAIADTDWQQPHSLNPIPSEEETRTVTINVEKALRKASELQPGVDAEKFVMTYFASHHPLAAEQRKVTKIVDGVMSVSVVSQRHEALIKQMLSAFELSGLWQVATELRVMETDVRLLNQFDWSASDAKIQCRRLDRRPNWEDLTEWEATFAIDALAWPPQDTTSVDIEPSMTLPCRAITISRLQSERLIHQMQKDARSNLMQAPKVTMFNGQCGMISDVSLRPFVTDVVEISGDLATAYQPKISVFDEGWRFLMKTTVTEEKQVNLQLVLTNSSVEGVKLANLPIFGITDPNQGVTVQVPTIHSDSIAVSSVLDADQALLVFSPKPYSSLDNDEASSPGRGMAQVFMVRTTLLPDSDLLKSFVPTHPTDSPAVVEQLP